MEKKTTLQYLPDELIIQILLRLPVKSLTRFKCVCKSWFSLISDTDFANSHFQLSSGTHNRRILLMPTSTTGESRSINFEASSFDDDSASVSLYPNFMPFESYSRISIKGSCRGFLLLHCYSQQMEPYWIYDIYLWNPSTGFHKKIPLSSIASHSDMQYCDDFYGFGYDHSTDDYLLVSYRVNYNRPPQSHLEFFSLRANMWKQIEGTQFSYTSPIGGVPPTTTGLLFNGAIHWLAYCHDLQKNVIVAFDLMEKKLFNLHLPHDDFDGKLNRYKFGLWAFGEFLALWVVYSDYLRLEVWVMKEYKVNSPWTKTLVFPFQQFYPICSTKSGDIINRTNGRTRTQLAKYNDQGQLLEHHSYFNNRHVCEGALYIESLLSLPDNEQA